MECCCSTGEGLIRRHLSEMGRENVDLLRMLIPRQVASPPARRPWAPVRRCRSGGGEPPKTPIDHPRSDAQCLLSQPAPEVRSWFGQADRSCLGQRAPVTAPIPSRIPAGLAVTPPRTYHAKPSTGAAKPSLEAGKPMSPGGMRFSFRFEGEELDQVHAARSLPATGGSRSPAEPEWGDMPPCRHCVDAASTLYRRCVDAASMKGDSVGSRPRRPAEGGDSSERTRTSISLLSGRR